MRRIPVIFYIFLIETLHTFRKRYNMEFLMTFILKKYRIRINPRVS